MEILDLLPLLGDIDVKEWGFMGVLKIHTDKSVSPYSNDIKKMKLMFKLTNSNGFED